MLVIPGSLKSQATTCRTQALALCWKITRADGTIYRFTDWPHELGVRESATGAPQTYTPTEGVDAAARRREGELEAVNKEIRGIVSATAIKTEDLRAGRFDGARIDEFLVSAATAWVGYIEHTRYRIKTVTYERGAWTAELEGLAGMLDRRSGDVWGPTCRADLFDAKCALSPTNFQKAVTVTSILVDRKEFQVTFSSSPGASGPLGASFPWWDDDGYGNDGKLIWTSGPNTGLETEIKEYDWLGSDVAKVVLHLPAPYTVSTTNAATIRPGCDKRSGTELLRVGQNSYQLLDGHCRQKYDNLVNFQGEPHIPGRDRALDRKTTL